MKNFHKIGKSYTLLFLIYHYNCSSKKPKNLKFFAISDYFECKFFTRQLKITTSELVEIADLLSKAGLTSFVQHKKTIFLFLTRKGIDFVANNEIMDQLSPQKNL